MEHDSAKDAAKEFLDTLLKSRLDVATDIILGVKRKPEAIRMRIAEGLLAIAADPSEPTRFLALSYFAALARQLGATNDHFAHILIQIIELYFAEYPRNEKPAQAIINTAFMGLFHLNKSMALSTLDNAISKCHDPDFQKELELLRTKNSPSK